MRYKTSDLDDLLLETIATSLLLLAGIVGPVLCIHAFWIPAYRLNDNFR